MTIKTNGCLGMKINMDKLNLGYPLHASHTFSTKIRELAIQPESRIIN